MSIDLRASRLDIEGYPGNEHTLTLTWPSGTLTGTSWAATIGGEAVDSVTVSGDDLVIVFTIPAATGVHDLILTQTNVTPNAVKAKGRVQSTIHPTATTTSTNLTVTLSTASGDVTVVGTGPAGDAGAGGVTDGDKGDITVTSSGTVWTIDSGVVTPTKLSFDPATQAELDAHAADTTSVHGITDTSALETTTGAQAKVDTHAADTTTHGTTGDIVGTSDTQTLTNKTLNSFTNYVEADAIHLEVRNVSGTTLPKGTPVYITGYNAGQERVTVGLADATSAATMPAIGITTEAIANNANGSIEARGRLEDLDTSAWSVGDELYVSETAGQLTVVVPNTTAKVQKVATVLRSHASLGVLDVVTASTATAYASETVYGVVRYATEAEASTGTAEDRVISPATGAATYQPLDPVLTATTASFTTADETKLDGIETGATADQTAAEILTAIKTVDGTGSGLDADTVDGNEANALLARANHTGTQAQSTIVNLVADLAAKADADGEYAVNTVAASGVTETLTLAPAHDVTMDQNCTFTFPTPTAGHAFLLRLSGAFTPTFPASVDWDSATAPTYVSPSEYGFSTMDGGTTWTGSLRASGLG